MESRSSVGIALRVVACGFVLSLTSVALSETSGVATASAPVQTVDPTVLKWSGNLRHRFDSIRNESPAAGKNETYDQTRLRLRLGAMANPVEHLKIEMRLATGTGGTSTNQSYGDTVKGSRNYEIKLDRAAFDYGVNDLLHVGGGRMANPFVLVGENDMLFDSDLNFDGTAFQLGQNWGDVEVGVSAGLFILDESKDTSAASASDVRLDALQVNAKVKMGWMDVIATAAEYTYNGVSQHAAIVTGDFAGNSNSGGVYTYGYRVTAYGLELQTTMSEIPIRAYIEMAQNAEGAERTASVVGLRLGQVKNVGDFAMGWDYREVQKDATLGILTDAEAFGGGTDGRSHRFSAGYSVNKSLSAWLTVLSGEKGISAGAAPAGRQRITLDALFKF